MTRAICQSNKDIDEQLLLGYLFFYNLGDIKVSESELESIFLKNNLDTRYVKKISKIDAFRRATTKTKASIMVQYNGEQKKARLEIDEVRCDNDEVVRILGRKLVDEKNEKLSYQAVGRIAFDRSMGNIRTSVDPFFADEYDYFQVMQDTEARYSDWSLYHTRDTVRNITNSVLKDMYPVNLLPTGLAKFIPKASKDTLYSLRGVIKDLSQFGTDCLFEVIPVIDTVEQRQLVNEAAEREVREDLHNFTQELKEIIQQKQSISTRTAASYVEKFKDLKNKVSEYEKLLGTYMGVLTQQIQQAYQLIEENTDEEVASIGA